MLILFCIVSTGPTVMLEKPGNTERKSYDTWTLEGSRVQFKSATNGGTGMRVGVEFVLSQSRNRHLGPTKST